MNKQTITNSHLSSATETSLVLCLFLRRKSITNSHLSSATETLTQEQNAKGFYPSLIVTSRQQLKLDIAKIIRGKTPDHH